MKLAFALALAFLTGCVDVDLGDDDTVADTGLMTTPQERCEEMVECGLEFCSDEIESAQACISDPYCSLDPIVDELYAAREECIMANGCWLVECTSAEDCRDSDEVLNQALRGMVDGTIASCSSL